MAEEEEEEEEEDTVEDKQRATLDKERKRTSSSVEYQGEYHGAQDRMVWYQECKSKVEATVSMQKVVRGRATSSLENPNRVAFSFVHALEFVAVDGPTASNGDGGDDDGDEGRFADSLVDTISVLIRINGCWEIVSNQMERFAQFPTVARSSDNRTNELYVLRMFTQRFVLSTIMVMENASGPLKASFTSGFARFRSDPEPYLNAKSELFFYL
uniref:Uncharacterized protein n=1 Tax=Vespula pensylvanica TaxID=30213 RepID=A0A834PBW1_VESPE|nr:hypothetical protein H0235_003463 [Vespula pensylvanica]